MSMFALFNVIPVIRQILVREHVDICHGHLSTSITMAMIMIVAKAIGLKTVVTEHTHFAYNDLGCI